MCRKRYWILTPTLADNTSQIPGYQYIFPRSRKLKLEIEKSKSKTRNRIILQKLGPIKKNGVTTVGCFDWHYLFRIGWFGRSNWQCGHWRQRGRFSHHIAPRIDRGNKYNNKSADKGYRRTQKTSSKEINLAQKKTQV